MQFYFISQFLSLLNKDLFLFEQQSYRKREEDGEKEERWRARKVERQEERDKLLSTVTCWNDRKSHSSASLNPGSRNFRVSHTAAGAQTLESLLSSYCFLDWSIYLSSIYLSNHILLHLSLFLPISHLYFYHHYTPVFHPCFYPSITHPFSKLSSFCNTFINYFYY